MYVHNILGSKGNIVHTIGEHAKIADAVAALNRLNIGALVVLDEADEIVGILSERDIIRALGADASATMALSVRDCMSPRPITCTLQTSIDDLMERMTHLRIRHIPVIDRGRLAGIVSIGDVVKRRIAETEQEAAALRDYIAS